MAVHLRIKGHVQGVGYRAWALREARNLGLSGWVRNRLDGSVEIAVAGAPDSVQRLAALCQQGPPSAQVGGVEESAHPDEVLPHPFEERCTA